MDIKCDKYFENYLKSVSNKQLISFYKDVEYTHFPILVINEYQRRFKIRSKKDVIKKLQIQKALEKIKRRHLTYFEKLKQPELNTTIKEIIKDIKIKSKDVGRSATKKGSDIGVLLKDQTKKGLAGGAHIAEKMKTSPMSNLELIELLWRLKHSGIITTKEFNEKKKVLLKKI